MTNQGMERLAVISTLLSIVVAAAWPFAHERRLIRREAGPGVRVVTLTGVARTGTWTEQELHAATYFAVNPVPARVVLKAGVPVLLRLKSSDVTHTFTCPDLGIAPVTVAAGHLADVRFTPKAPGSYPYYCTTVCGMPHFGMRGAFRVVAADAATPHRTAIDQPPLGRYWEEPAPADGSLVARGRWLYRRNGCFTCHGEEGRGGVRNPNYVKETEPALDGLGERMLLFFPEDRQAIVAAMEDGKSLDSMKDRPPVRRFPAVLAQYHAVFEVIRGGNTPGKADPNGFDPPLVMPAWGQRLSNQDIDSLIAYLLSLEPPAES